MKDGKLCCKFKAEKHIYLKRHHNGSKYPVEENLFLKDVQKP